MFKKIIYLLILPVAFSFMCGGSLAQQEDIVFSKDDRVLVLAPHPDDEAIAAAGVIQKALEAKAKVKVVCLTNGDNNELSFIVYEKRLTFRKREFLHMGEVRSKETVSAMEFLGLSREDIIFLGYPDFGTMRIFTEYWGNSKPYKSWLTRVSKVSYPEAMSVGSPYVGESILKDIKLIISTYKPTKIFVSHAADVNRDHRALYCFLKIALLDLKGLVPEPEVYPYLVHAIRWPMPRGKHEDLELKPPESMENSGIVWKNVHLMDDEIETKYAAIKHYKSQIPYAPSYLVSFARKNEFFGDFPVVALSSNGSLGDLQWRDLRLSEGIGEDEEDSVDEFLEYDKPLFNSIAFALQKDYLWVRLTLQQNMTKNLGVVIYLFGYNKNLDFGQMPKIQIPINLLGIHLKDKKQTLSVKKIKYIREGKVFTMKIPLSLLGDPDYIFTYVRAHGRSLPIETSAWRILKLD